MKRTEKEWEELLRRLAEAAADVRNAKGTGFDAYDAYLAMRKHIVQAIMAAQEAT